MDRFVFRLAKKGTHPEEIPENSSHHKEKTPEEGLPGPSNMDHTYSVRANETIHLSQDSNETSAAEDEENENIANDEPVKGRKKKIYKQKYRESFKNRFGDWVITTEKKEIFCKVCKIIINGGVTHIERHSKTLKHIKKIQAAKNTPKISTIIEDSTEYKLQQKIKISEILLIMFLAEHNLPFLLLDHLTKFLPAVCPDSEIAKKLQMNRKKGTLLCKSVIAPEQKHLLQQDLNQNFYSLIIDETTDISTSKTLAVVCRYYKANKVNERFLGLMKLEESTADGIFKAIISFLKENNISLNNMIGFAADNAHTMMGNRNGVQAKFKTIIPHIFVLGCICHSFNLCSSSACSKLPLSVEKLVRDISNYFSNSSSRLMHLRECQTFLNLKPHKMLKLSQTRWLSLQAVIDRIVEQYDSLILFFTNEVYDNQNVENPQSILAALQNPVFKMYFLFLGYILNIINKLNLEFQSSELRLHGLLQQITSLYRTIVRNFIKKEFLFEDVNQILINNPHHYVQLENLYLGAKCQLLILNSTISSEDLNSVRLNCLKFYIELANQIKSRFSFNDITLKMVKIIDPDILYSSSDEYNSLVPIVDRFPVLCDDIEKLDSEWRLLQDNFEIKKNHSKKSPLEFWNYIFSLKNELNEMMFPHLKKCISGLLCLPHSSASAERIFSQLNLIKTKTRNRLSIQNCDSLLHTKELLFENACYSFKPNLSLLQRKINYKKVELEDSDDESNLTF